MPILDWEQRNTSHNRTETLKRTACITQ